MLEAVISADLTVLLSKARDRESGDISPWESSKKGRLISIWPLKKGAPMVMNNLDGSLTRTSLVESFHFENNRLLVTTENSIYELFIIN